MADSDAPAAPITTEPAVPLPLPPPADGPEDVTWPGELTNQELGRYRSSISGRFDFTQTITTAAGRVLPFTIKFNNPTSRTAQKVLTWYATGRVSSIDRIDLHTAT